LLLSRRRVLTIAAGLSGSALFAVACGKNDNKGNSGSGASATGPATQPPRASAVVGNAVKTGGRVVAIVSSDPTGMDPHTGQGGGDHQFFWTVFDNFVNYNQKGELDPAISLAEKWEIVGGTRINFTLRQGITFHDGTPFNAQAVKYNIERVQNEATKSSARAQILPVTKIEVVNDTTMAFVLDKPNAALLTNLGDRGGAIISPASIEKYGKDTGRNPVGTGPFKFKEWAQGDHVTVVKNTGYWGKDAAGTAFPYLDEMRWNVVPDATVAVANLQSGTADVIFPLAGDRDRIKSDARFQVEEAISGGWSGSYINQALAPMDDLHFRRAVALAHDRAAVVQAVTLGQGRPAKGPMGPASWAYNPNLNGLDFNLAEAQKELAQSKYPNGTRVEVITINTQPYLQVCDLLKQMLKKINVDLDVKPIAVAELTNRAYVVKDAPVTQAGLSARADPDGLLGESLHSQGFYNPGHLPNPQVDDLVEKARQTYVQDERKKFYDQLQQLAIDQVFDIYLYYSNAIAAAPSKVKNLSTIWGVEGKQRWKQLWIQS
jgi:peptide/nickel transport system substrate-binding protein